MLLALGSLLLDTTVGTVVVGTNPGADPAARADALWLTSPSPDQVAAAAEDRPVGITVDDLGSLRELVDAGAVALECRSPEAVDAALDLALTLWCTPHQAQHATAVGLPPERLVTEIGEASCAAVVGATVSGHGPEAWGEVVRAVLAGARVLRTDDVKAVRRVTAVLDRLVAARGDAPHGAVA